MSLQVLTAITGHREAPLVAALGGPGMSITVVRRCADLPDLLAAAAAGLGEAAVLSGDVGMLDRESVGRLQRCGVTVVVLADAGDDEALRLRRLGVDAVLEADVPAGLLADAVQSAVARRKADGARTGAGALLLADPADALTPLPTGATRPVVPSGPLAVESDEVAPPGELIVVWGPAGAPGRTTVAVTLAAQLARHADVLLVDADTHGASVAQALGLLDESAGLAAAARAANQGALDLARLRALSSEVSPRLRVLTGLPQPKRWPELRPGSLEEVWGQSRRLARWVVVDAGFGLETDEELMFDVAAPRRHGATLSALAAADLAIAVGAAEPVGMQRLLALLPDLGEAVPPGVRVQVVMTRVRDSAVGKRADQLVRRALERYAGVGDPILLPDERDVHDGAMLAGRSIPEFAPEARSAVLLGALADTLAVEAGLAGADDGRRGRTRRRWAG